MGVGLLCLLILLIAGLVVWPSVGGGRINQGSKNIELQRRKKKAAGSEVEAAPATEVVATTE